MDQLSQHGHVPKYEQYSATYQEVEKKLIEVMKINKQNKCQRCGEVYREMINREGLCGDEI